MAFSIPTWPGWSRPSGRSAGTLPGVTAACDRPVPERVQLMMLQLRRAVCRADTGPVIGADFAALLAQAQGRDEEAFARLYRDAQPALLRYLKVIAPQGAEDVAGETWLHVVTGLAGFTGGEGAFPAWLFTIAPHPARDAGPARGRPRSLPLAHGGAGGRLAAPGPGRLRLGRAP